MHKLCSIALAILMGCGFSGGGPGTGQITNSLSPNGTACAGGVSCASGFCSDGVCCDTACGGGVATDCQACSFDAGGSVDGTCSLIARGTTCRASTSGCDYPEKCDGASTACPADVKQPDGVTCDTSCWFGGGKCSMGQCLGTMPLPKVDAGESCLYKDATNDADCHSDRFCDGKGGCGPEAMVPAGTPCLLTFVGTCGHCNAAHRCAPPYVPAGSGGLCP